MMNALPTISEENEETGVSDAANDRAAQNIVMDEVKGVGEESDVLNAEKREQEENEDEEAKKNEKPIDEPVIDWDGAPEFQWKGIISWPNTTLPFLGR
ncbi:MAG: hypothetical protein GY820_31745 [Gammaproteobacteria bacterium]|nr:hypothetical protein [Gammaproteobacteria bacterium]